MKICKECKIEKDFSLFLKRKGPKDGYNYLCKECVKEYRKEYNKSNKEKIRKQQQDYYLNNKEQILVHQKKYESNKVKTDIQYKLSRAIRSRLRSALKGNVKSGSAVRNMGCTISELMVRFEKQFQPGMAWNNHGHWHIDHIKPLSSFDLTNRQQFLEACHYSNLQPLWATENLHKAAKL